MRATNISDSIKVTTIKTNQASGGTAINTDSVDMDGYDGVIFVGALDTANAGNSVNLAQSEDNITFHDLEGTRQVPSGDSEEIAIELVKPRKRFVRAEIDRSGADSATQTFFAIQYNLRKSLGPSPGVVSVSSPEIVEAVQEVLWSLPGSYSHTWRGAVGRQGDIPTPTVFADIVTDYSAPVDGTSDCRAAIESAVAACPAGQTITVPAGTFTIDGGGYLNLKGVHLKGAGRTSTRIICKNGARFQIYGNAGFPKQELGVVGGPRGVSGQILNAGDRWIDVSDASGVSAGEKVFLAEEDDGTIVDPVGAEPGTWNPRGFSPPRNKEQNFVVESVDGNRITFVDPSVHSWSTTQNVQVYHDSATAVDSGLSDMTLGGPDESDQPTEGLLISQAANCWVENVKFVWCERQGIYLRDAVRCTIRSCDFQDFYWLTSSGGYGLRMDLGPSNCLIENCYFAGIRVPGPIISGGVGNVVGYCYLAYPIHETPNIQQKALSFHACYPSKNLVEGCIIGPRCGADNTHGNSRANGFFRCALDGASEDARISIAPSKLRWAANVDQDALDYWFAGCVVGRALTGAVYEAEGEDIVDTDDIEFRLGYVTDGDMSAAGNDPEVKTSLLRYQNYSTANGGIESDPGQSGDLPDSLYLTEKPSWYGAAVWPPINPEGAVVEDIPAKTRFESDGGRAALGVAQFLALVPLDQYDSSQKMHGVAYDPVSGLAVGAHDFLGCDLFSVDSETGEIVALDTIDVSMNSRSIEKIGSFWVAGDSNGDIDVLSVSGGDTLSRVSGLSMGSTVVRTIATDGTYGAACVLADGLRTFSLDGAGTPTAIDTEDPVDHTCHNAIFASGGNIYATFQNTAAGDSYIWVATHSAGVMTEVEKVVIGTSTPYPVGIAATDDNVYVATTGDVIQRFSRGVNGALTAQETYSIPNYAQALQIAGSRLWVPCLDSNVISFIIQGDGTLVEDAKTAGITKTTGGSGTENFYVHADGFDGIRTWRAPE